MDKNEILEKLNGKLIVSCESETDSLLHTPDIIARFATEAVKGGAAAVRCDGAEITRNVVNNVDVPVIGFTVSEFDDGFVKITGSFDDVEKLLEAKCDIIAVDGTIRKREKLTGPEFIQEIKKRHNCVLLADVATYEDGLVCEEAGADLVSTKLSGYTPDTNKTKSSVPDYRLVESLAEKLSIPVLSEGRISTPQIAAKIMELGAWSIVVGTAITRPDIVTGWFTDALTKK